jgi:hypothetical protein
VNAPRLMIIVALEKSAPKVLPCWQHEGDRDRLFDWLEQRPELRKLVDDAVFLELQEGSCEAIDDPWEEAA